MQRSFNDNLSLQHALQQFQRLGYSIIDGSQEEQGDCNATGRNSLSEVVLLSRLRNALRMDLNSDCPSHLLELAVEELTRSRSLFSLVQANKQIYNMLRDGIKIDARGQLVTTEDPGEEAESHGTVYQDRHKTVHIIDWREPNNDFTVVTNFWVEGKLGKRCLDMVVFVNGLPLVVFAVTDSELSTTFDRVNQDYKETLSSLFWYNAFVVVADAFTCKMGSLTSPWEHFFQWKRVHDEREDESTRLNTLIEGTCEKTRLLDIIENFTLFDEGGGLHKLVARNHQYLGVNNAVASLLAWQEERADRRQAGEPDTSLLHGKLGVFWHTQGSGKSYSMVFFARKVHRTIDNSYMFLVVTDREDLDQQIFENFSHTGTISEDEEEIHARDAEHLKRLLGESHLILFTLIQKFRSEQPGQDYTRLSSSEKIIVMADEAHRTQYDTLAKNLRNALPKASFIGFTGTPLMDGEEQTRETFGHYVSIYNFRRAINDGVTVPLYFENHTLQVDRINDNFQEEMSDLLEEAMLDERQKQKVIEQYARSTNLFVKSERLDYVARDIVRHFMNRGYMGKALVVSIDKITAVRTFNRVEEQWRLYKEELEAQLAGESDPDMRVELAHKIAYMEQTERAVVVSSDDGDSEHFAEFSRETGEQVDIAPHHERFRKEKLAENFKAAEHPLRIAFVCAMWMTGFDVPCLSTIYLDRPLKGHTLMQTIARANRVYQDKNNGLVVDYASTMRALAAALAIYAREDSSGYSQGDQPIGDKRDLVQKLGQKLEEIGRFCEDLGIDVAQLLVLLANEPDKRRQQDLLLPTIDILVAYDEIKLHTLILTSEVNRLYKAILPDPMEQAFSNLVRLYVLVKDGIYSTMRATGVGDILTKVNRLVHESLQVQQNIERYSADTQAPRGHYDLRDIDLGELQTNLRSGHRHIKTEQMRHLLYERIKRMIEINPRRVKYMAKLDRALTRYNEGCANLATDPQLINPDDKIKQLPALSTEQEHLEDEYINAIVELTSEIAQEEQRGEQEGLDEYRLAIFDLIADGIDLNEEESRQVKVIVNEVVTKLHPTLKVPDWKNNSQAFNQAYVIIETALSPLPPSYSDDMFHQKCNALFLYIQEHENNDESTSVAS